MYSIPKEIVTNHIISHLYSSDLKSLYNVSTKFRRLMSLKHIGNMLTNRMSTFIRKSFKEDAIHLQNFLKESSSVISGSFIIQGILGEDYKHTDVDIFVPPSCTEDSINSFIQNIKLEILDRGANYYYYDNSVNVKNIREFVYRIKPDIPHLLLRKECSCEWFDDTDTDKNMNDGFESEVPLLREDHYLYIQIIFLDASPLSHIEYFDFSIVKSMYYYKFNKPVVEIEDLAGIINKIFKVDNIQPSIEERVIKYTKREFKIKQPTIEGDIIILKAILSSYKRKVVKTNKLCINKGDIIYPCQLSCIVCPTTYFKRIYRHIHILCDYNDSWQVVSEKYKEDFVDIDESLINDCDLVIEVDPNNTPNTAKYSIAHPLYELYNYK